MRHCQHQKQLTQCNLCHSTLKHKPYQIPSENSQAHLQESAYLCASPAWGAINHPKSRCALSSSNPRASCAFFMWTRVWRQVKLDFSGTWSFQRLVLQISFCNFPIKLVSNGTNLLRFDSAHQTLAATKHSEYMQLFHSPEFVLI